MNMIIYTIIVIYLFYLNSFLGFKCMDLWLKNILALKSDLSELKTSMFCSYISSYALLKSGSVEDY